MTYQQALDLGFRPGHTAWQRGYVSRKVDIKSLSVVKSSRGYYYVVLPSWLSTLYCIRQYLITPDGFNGLE